MTPRCPAVSFIVPVRDDEARLRRCLESIGRNRGPIPIEVIVADNGSSDRSVEVAESAGARVLSLPGMPVAAVRNQAADAARGDVLAFVDADHEIDAAWVASAVDVLRESNVAAAGAMYEAPSNGTWVQRSYGALRRASRQRRHADWLASGNLAVRRSVFQQLGGFDTTLETCEDVDFCRRLRARGYALLEDPRLRSVHHGDPLSLRALFLAELWRGRDNLRASLRGKLRLRELPSIAIPLGNLILLVCAAIGLLTLSGTGLLVAASAMVPVLGFSILRASIMTRRRNPATLGGFMQVIPVAFVYDVSRALALVARPGHHVRRRA